jgi:hypothetical protein
MWTHVMITQKRKGRVNKREKRQNRYRFHARGRQLFILHQMSSQMQCSGTLGCTVAPKVYPFHNVLSPLDRQRITSNRINVTRLGTHRENDSWSQELLPSNMWTDEGHQETFPGEPRAKLITKCKKFRTSVRTLNTAPEQRHCQLIIDWRRCP